ncbi:Histidyl-tRNA synthetase [Thermodesulfobacterium geofontis OPF15]|jgi:histidyl-tRNA synthetase|uniref:Histidine--tRNA ligase n=1 Tax=Thermodesulfobacterium geofontis (strain OPF15) TaxID=795359 RepID=F8C3N3_THEGP|nr:histidine--tRNA ligase [Thermodesulfobacterium geofontis]AEH22482.1 Histidyl-tRNA synthetase [Thermodesulfobacterium geofontis OPF15]
MKIQAVRGFKDWLPEDFAKYEYLIKLAKNILKTYNYKEIKIPILEKTELFVRSIGEFTDIVQKETYTFQDRNKEFLTLRPEATAGICRMIIEKGLFVNPKPLKFFTIGPMFRHERPQKGRLREFYQIDVELFSPLNPHIEAELIFLAMEILKAPFSSQEKNIYTLELNTLGCPNCRIKYKEDLLKFLEENKENLCETCKERITRNPLRVLDCKNETCKEVVSKSPIITEYLCKECKDHFISLKEVLDFIGIKYIENPRLVRGLDYYVRTIFEIKAKGLGAQDTVAAGGRYDYLLKELGGPELPAIGFAIGLERWAISIFGDEENKGILESKKILEKLNPDLFIILLGKELLNKGFELATLLRKKGIRCEITYEEKSLKAQLKNADKLLAKYSLILGDEELKKKSAILRNMKKSIQEEVEFKNWEDLSTKVLKKIKNES